MPSTIEDFNRAVDALADLAAELGLNATSCEMAEEDTSTGTQEVLTVYFDHPQANPLTINAVP